MSAIEKLAVIGVRSFDPQGTSVIEFTPPLTLIVGHNGAGKTTIIECLKYVTTGSLPPDSNSGQAFVHDPTLAGEKEVKAQVRMRFRGVDGQPATVIRSLRLAALANHKLKLNTLDATLVTYDSQGNKQHVTKKNADMDAELPPMLGVSAAVLENVVFCHQEDSNWPLGNSKELKERFDAIFSSERYTKALDMINDSKKELQARTKEQSLELKRLEDNLNAATRIREEMAEVEKLAANQETRIHELSATLHDQSAQINAVLAKEEALKATEKERDMLRNRRGLVESERANLQAHMGDVLDHSQAELEDMAKEFDKEIKEVEDRLAKFRRAKEMVERDAQIVQHEIHTLSEALWKAKAKIELLKKKKEARDEFLAEATAQSLPIDSCSVEGLLQAIQHAARSANEELEAIRQANEVELSLLVDASERARRQRSDLENLMRQSQQRIQAAQRDLDEARQKKAGMETLIADSKALNERLDAQRNALKMFENDEKEAQVRAEMETVESEKTMHDEESRQLSKELQRLSTQAEQRALARQKILAVKNIEENMHTLHKEFDDLFKEAGGEDSGMLERVKISIAEREAEYTAAQAALTRYDHELESKVMRKLKLGIEIAEKEAKMVSLDENLKILGFDVHADFAALETVCVTEISALRSQIARSEGEKHVYSVFSEQAKQQHCCPVCERDVPDDAIPTLIQRLQTKIPSDDKLAVQLREKENELEKLKSAKGIWFGREDARGLYNKANEELRSLTASLKELEIQRSESETMLRKAAQMKERALSALEPASALFRLRAEHESANRELHEMDTSALEREESIEDVSTRLEHCNARRWMALQKEATALRDEEKQLRINVAELEAELRSTEEARAEIGRIGNVIAELESKISEENNIYVELEAKWHESEMECAKAMDTLNMRRNELKMTEKRKQEAVDERIKIVQRAESLQSDLTNAEVEDPEADYTAANEAKVARKKQLDELRKKVDSYTEKIDQMATAVGHQDALRRNLTDNLRLRELDSQLKDMTEKIAGLDIKLLGGSGEDRAAFEALRRQHDRDKSERDRLLGAQQAHKTTVEARVRELASEQYADIDNRHRFAFIGLHTTEEALKDVVRYYDALDKALTKYHTLKMSEVNKVIRELWQSTYKGNDIEAIEIRADISMRGSRRVYQYRVVMIKNGIPIDMRGRCSAGQKVITSLIIRLALAETFCLNAGILALDEPTTNLDRQNIESLALALVNIIEARRAQQNFQLIVITHDESFVQLLGRSDQAEHYWRVFKDQHGHSTIERRDIGDL